MSGPSCVCCTEHVGEHRSEHCSGLSTSAGAERSMQGSLGSPARLCASRADTPGRISHQFQRGQSRQLMDEISSVLSAAVRLSLGGGLCSSAAAAAAAAAAAWCQRTAPPIRAGRRPPALP